MHLTSNYYEILRKSRDVKYEIINMKYKIVDSKYEIINMKYKIVDSKYEIVNMRYEIVPFGYAQGSVGNAT